jgi:dipeptidyl aminopeptidase/acylaminoacyl peptidase
MNKLICALLLLLSCLAYSQKKVIDHTAYNSWKKNEQQKVSVTGRYVSYEINPHRGDGWLYIYDTQKATLDSFPRGKEARFAPNEQVFIFKIVPGFDTLRNSELTKIDKKKWPKDSLGIYWIAKDSLVKISLMKSFQVGEEHNWLSYTVDTNESITKAATPTKKKKKKKKKEAETKPAYTSEGKRMHLLNMESGQSKVFYNVNEIKLSKKGRYAAILQHRKDKVDSTYLSLVDLKGNLTNPLVTISTPSIKQLAFSPNEQQLAIVSSSDTSKTKNYLLQLFSIDQRTIKTISDTSKYERLIQKQVSEHYTPLFTEDNRLMYFGIMDRAKPEPKDSLLESEKVKLDIWHHQDKRLQPQQLVELKRDQKRHDLFGYLLVSDTLVQLSNDTLEVRSERFLKGNYLHGTSNEASLHESQWETPIRENHYRISILDGKTELIKSDVLYSGELSPKGRYFSYYNPTAKHHYLRDNETKTEACITCALKTVQWEEDINGMPMLAPPVGWIGYDEKEEQAYFHSRYGIWSYSIPDERLSRALTPYTEQSGMRFNVKKWQYDSVYVNWDNVIVEGFNEKTKNLHLFGIESKGSELVLTEWLNTPHKLSGSIRSKDRSTIAYRLMSVSAYPDVHVTRNNFTTSSKISTTNPQQNEYNWASVELISWKAYDGQRLEGLVYKPENFDPNQKYPLIIYYYELNADELHSHSAPRPTASIIHPTEYASAGYIVLIPDIRYTPGQPAKSAYNSIMSSTDYVLKKYPSIDSTRMGLQGQSWGGYQTAQLITMTNRYKAAMAGAPVSNMISAYGGIRWASGVNRQFQYERTQSRIGKTIWEAPELYIENSPLFHLPKVKTPLLIMANDKDGAVPWYQGIELYTGMKRLGKTVWMLNYNGEEHNLQENANRMDLSIRMRQYFDHYLLNKPAPQWMSEGIPAVQKGKMTGY